MSTFHSERQKDQCRDELEITVPDLAVGPKNQCVYPCPSHHVCYEPLEGDELQFE